MEECHSCNESQSKSKNSLLTQLQQRKKNMMPSDADEASKSALGQELIVTRMGSRKRDAAKQALH